MKVDEALVKLRALGCAEEAHAAAVEMDRIRAAFEPLAKVVGRIGHMDGAGAVLVPVKDLRAAIRAMGGT